MDQAALQTKEVNEKCHPLICDNLEWVQQVLGPQHQESPHLFSDILDLNSNGCLEGAQSYQAKKRAILASECMEYAPCGRCHDTLCKVPAADFGVSGLPCEDMSKAGQQLKKHGRTNTVYMTHGKYVKKHGTPLFVVECTPVLGLNGILICSPGF